jgi:Tol biopolymer transport system component
MSRVSSRFAVRAILTFCSATALVLAAPAPRPVAVQDSLVAECSKHEECDDGNACTQDICKPHTGTCEYHPVHQGLACNDGNACTSVDACDHGICRGSDRPDGTSCSDGNACTQSDTCQSGACTGADPVICSPSDQCHVAGTCEPATGSCSQPAAPDGTACDDTETCSGQDACEAGVCTVPGAVVQKIAFSTTRDKPVPDPGTLAQVNLEVYLMNPDGTGEVRLTNNGVNDSFAALSPDGKGRIVFDSARNSPPGSPSNVVDLFLMRADGSNVQFLTSGSSSATWSPDSTSIAFHRSVSGNAPLISTLPGAPAVDSDIFAASMCDLLAGMPPTNVTNSVGFIDTDASWSPDGTKIVFTRFSDTDNLLNPTGAEIFTIHPDGTGLTQLTHNSVEERGPSWSNDGTRIAYMCKQGTVAPNVDNEICVMNADGSGQVQLTFNTTFDGTPTFSPGDTKILFTRNTGGTTQQVFTMSPNGTGVTQLTFTAGTNLFPDWGFVRSR